MSKKVFDLMPPYGKKDEIHHHPALKKKKEKVKAKKLFALVILALFFILIFLGLEKTQQTTQQNKQDALKKTTANSSFELFDNQGQSSLTGNTKDVKVRLLDGASNEDTARTVKDILLKKGYTIESSQKSATASAKTIIYYQKDKLSSAQGVQTLLKDPYNPSLEESDLTSAKYDVLVLIGS